MTKQIGSTLLILQVLVWMSFLACTLEEPDATDSSPALSLQAEQFLSLTVLHWDPVTVTGFKEYVLLQSSQDIPNDPTPKVNTHTTVIKRIDEADNISFSVSSVPFASTICYKLYAAVDDRFLYSPTICVDQHFDMIPGFYDRACHEAGQDEIVMFDRINDRLSSYNYQTRMLTQFVTDIVLNFPTLKMSTWENVTQIFGFDQSPAWLRKYNFPSLTAAQSKNYNHILWAVNVHQSFVFLAIEEPGRGFQVLKREDLSLIDFRAGLSGVQNIAIFPGDPLVVMVIGSGGSRRYILDETGRIISEEQLPVVLNQPDLQGMTAEGSTLFIAGNQGTIINRQGEIAGKLTTSLNTHISLIRLTQDEQKALYIMNDSGVQSLAVTDITHLPAMVKLKTFELPSMNYADLFVADDIIHLIGTQFTGSQPQTFILRYPL